MRAANYEVDNSPFEGSKTASLAAWGPAAIVVDLSRHPMQGRDAAALLRKNPALRKIPLVFTEGEPDKIGKVKESLPDATYSSWSRIRSTLKEIFSQAHPDPAVPLSATSGYSGTPLARKLGIKPGVRVGLLGAPTSFAAALGKLPEGVTLQRSPRGRCDVIVWFVTKRSELERELNKIMPLFGTGGLWIAWPKKTSSKAPAKGSRNGSRDRSGDRSGAPAAAPPPPTDLNQVIIRKVGMSAGLVDYKACAIDPVWSGVRFTRRAVVGAARK